METKMLQHRMSGIFYLLLAITGFVADGIWKRLIVIGDGHATMELVTANIELFQVGLFSNAIMTVVWVLLALILHRELKACHMLAAETMVALVCVGSTLTLMSTIVKTAILHLTLAQANHALIAVLVELSDCATMYAFLFFSLWLLPLAYLIFKSPIKQKPVKWLLSFALIIAAAGYLADYLFFQFGEAHVHRITQFTFYGEVTLLLWLLLVGTGEKTTYPSTSIDLSS